ncbi:MAG: glycosyltransferase [Pseudorhodobacter sp. PARRP1]|nr:MAG: glycosyltransferase [Pseudorhodobacter sp. PARRP1]
MLGHIAFIAVMVGLGLSLPFHAIGDVGSALVVVGVIGLWRYTWAAINFGRAALFLKWVYPARRARAMAAYAALPTPAHAYFLVTSYKIEPEVTTRVYQALFRAAAASAGGATVVCSVVDTADARLIRNIFDRMAVDTSTTLLMVDQIAGTGKRDALARSLRLIAGEAPTRRDIVLFVDGDSCVPEDIVAATAPFFTNPDMGAVTTDEEVEIRATDMPLFRDWFMLRFNQRQVMMSSMGLSDRVLTLTGRMSVVRADLATNAGFIQQVQSDFIDHWRLGRVNFLTGDDKSTWFWLLKNGYKMGYLPDVASLSMESQPRPGFVDSALTLMMRWFGNMLRTNGRALSLSPNRIGWFTWWSILDQRVGIWTTLAGPISVLLGAAFIEPLALPVYIAWIMFTRYTYCWILATVRMQPFPITYPFLLYFSQITGAAVKSFVLFRLDRQRWTRQSTRKARAVSLPLGQRLQAYSSTFSHALALGWLTLGVVLLSGIV